MICIPTEKAFDDHQSTSPSPVQYLFLVCQYFFHYGQKKMTKSYEKCFKKIGRLQMTTALKSEAAKSKGTKEFHQNSPRTDPRLCCE